MTASSPSPVFAEGLTPARLRSCIVGGDAVIRTPFGERRMLYADYTASGRALTFVEARMAALLPIYANSHTEDDVTGRTMTTLLHEAKERIKTCVNAGPGGRVVAVGTGATGAIARMQQIIGVALPPATRARLDDLVGRHAGARGLREFRDFCRAQQPVVFVGPYEHHSNEVSWRESLATVIEVPLGADGGIDMAALETLLTDPAYRQRPRIGSFSAASNVTGLRTDVAGIAALLHRHQALACFDFAASAPYVKVDMNPPARGDGDASLDAVFISPHKFLGGPGASGILVFNQACYDRGLPPTLGGGGTVDFVGPRDHHYVADIEAREEAGTPGINQLLRAALAFEVKRAVGETVIEERESAMLSRAFRRWREEPNIEILGVDDPARRIGIVSFNLRDGDGYLHPRFVTTLLDDLFGIQSRAGCSCAGPYGHALLGIDDDTARRYRHWIVEGVEGIKPGWCRVGFHYVFDDAEVDYLVEAVAFVARHGRRFLPLYRFDPACGAFSHHAAVEGYHFDDLLAGRSPVVDAAADPELRAADHRRALAQAEDWLERLDEGGEAVKLAGEVGALQFFTLLRENLADTVATAGAMPVAQAGA